VAYDAIAFYGVNCDALGAHFASGDDHRLLESLNVPMGEGLVGWVAEVGQPMLNGNPSVEPSKVHPVARARAAAPVRKAALDFPTTLGMEEALAVASIRIKGLVSYDAIAFYGVSGDALGAHFASGDDQRLLESLNVPMGEGLIGWVAEVGQPMLNGNPSVEPGWVVSFLSSAIALPIVDAGRTIGVMALYRKQADAFTAHELVSLLPVCPAVAALLVEKRAASSEVAKLSEALAG